MINQDHLVLLCFGKRRGGGHTGGKRIILGDNPDGGFVLRCLVPMNFFK